MDAMPLHFGTLRYLGLWREHSRQHRLVKYIWRPFVINVILLFTISLLLATPLFRGNIKNLTECIFLSLTYVGLCLKLLNFLCRRDAMDRLSKEFREDIFRPRNIEEAEITTKYEKMISLIFYLHMGISQLTGLAFLSLPVISMVKEGHETDFPMKLYEICCKGNLACYSLLYVFLILGVVIGIAVNVVLEAMLVCFILLICGQMDLSCRRFVKSSDENFEKSVKEFITHQIFIRKIVRQLESFFMPIAVPLVLFSMITLCTSVYNLSKTKIGDPESFYFFMYLWTMLIQLLFYCWSGNELKFKRTAISKTMYSIDWLALKASDRKTLWFIMLSYQREMGISFHGFCTISLEIFVWVLKTSYAAYNLLKTVETFRG